MRSIPDDATIFLKPGALWFRTKDGSFGAYYDGLCAAAIRSFPAWETAILDRLAKGSTKAELRALGVTTNTGVDLFLADLQDWGSGALDWQASEIVEAKADHRRLIEAQRLRDIWAAMASDETENDRFHRFGLDRPDRQFDQVETTISHVFREPHSALSGRRYGEAFCDWLVAGGLIGADCRLIEIGCGLGYFANALLDRLAQQHPDLYASISYTMFDLSPKLGAAQRARCARHAGKLNFIVGNIETHHFVGARFDLVLSNEVIADLSVATISMASVESGTPESEAEALAVEYQLDCVPIVQGAQRKALINAGAIKMLRSLYRCMGEGSTAVVTEYGSADRSPKAVLFDNHKEFTVHFGQLAQVAQQLGFKTARDTMGRAIGFDGDCSTIRMESLRTLSYSLLPFLGREPLPMLAYTPQTLGAAMGGLIDNLGNLSFLSLEHPASFSPFRFELLTLSK